MPFDTDPQTQDMMSRIALQYNQGLPVEKQINDTDFVYDAPLAHTPDATSAKNTLLIARPIATSGKYGLIRIYYDRIDVSNLPAHPGVARDGNTTRADVINAINTYYGINLTTNDYVAGFDITGANATIVMQASSIGFINQITVPFLA